MDRPTPVAPRRFWWVNQNQTFRQEFGGGYLWSPKRKTSGALNPFYETMREVAPSDVVFSFASTRIQAIGIATDYCYEAPKPGEFGMTGKYWNTIGWKVPVAWTQLQSSIRPSEHMARLAPLLPSKYAPLRVTGQGLQSVYLAEIPESMALELGLIIGPPEQELIRDRRAAETTGFSGGRGKAELIEWEDHLEREIVAATDIADTTRESLIKARRGQGTFREKVLRIEPRCRVTKVDRAEHLVASHCKPWRDCTSADERLDGENGLMLTPTIDHLFDRGFITFEGCGRLIVSPSADRRSLVRMGIDVDRNTDVGAFSEGQRAYLEFHREQVFLRSANRDRLSH